MKTVNILRLITYICVFAGAWFGFDSISKKNIHKGLREIMGIGVVPLAFISGIRHMFYHGSIIKNQRFFEFEAGGANIGIALAGLLSLINNMNNDAMGVIFLIYAVYLFMGTIAWVYIIKRSRSAMIIGFLSITGLLSYSSYIAFTNKN